MDYAFTSIDAVYVWTRGGYQVARDPEDYPLFIAVHESDLDADGVLRSIWNPDFRRAPARYRLRWCDTGCSGATATDRSRDGRWTARHPLQETAAFANEHYAHFQSALDMLGRMYDSVDTDANYRPN